MKVRWFSLCLIAAFLWGCHWFDAQPIPKELRGQWETSEPRYEDCVVEIGERMIIFRNGLKHVVFYHVTKVDKAPQAGQILYRLHYETADGLKYEFPILYAKSNEGPVIRFKNQPDIQWVKTEVFFAG